MYNEDIQTIKSALGVFLSTRNGIARNVMHLTIRKVLDLSGVSELELPSCYIQSNGDKYVRVLSKRFVSDEKCPKCGENIYGNGISILSIFEDEYGQDKVTYGCKCGTIFGKVEQTDRAKLSKAI